MDGPNVTSEFQDCVSEAVYLIDGIKSPMAIIFAYLLYTTKDDGSFEEVFADLTSSITNPKAAAELLSNEMAELARHLMRVKIIDDTFNVMAQIDTVVD